MGSTEKDKAMQFGVGLRRGHFEQIIEGASMPDFFEFVPEAFLGVGGRAARALSIAQKQTRLVAHGVSLNLGSPDPLAMERLQQLARFLDAQQVDVFSDHLCASAIDGIESFDLLPVPFHGAMVEHIVARGRIARAVLGRPLMLENITAYAFAPGSQMSEGEFVTHVLEELDAGLLLDVANIVVNARNQRVSSRTLLDALPLHRVAQIHLAGHRYEPQWRMTVDDHASAVSDETMELYRCALLQIGRPVPTLVEWDQQLPAYETLLAESERARQVATDAFAAKPLVQELHAHR